MLLDRKKKLLPLLGYFGLLILIVVAAFLTGKQGGGETIKEVMKDAVLHEDNRIAFLGGMTVNPGLISAYTVTGILLLFAAVMRIFVIPHFKEIPGKLQTLLETLVGMFDNLAKSNSPHRNGFLGAYVFGAGVYIFVSTIFELLGLQVVTTTGRSMSMPAPLSDINGAIAMGCVSYLVILYRVKRFPGRGQHAEGVLPAHLHELPPVRRYAQRSAGHGAGVLHHHA